MKLMYHLTVCDIVFMELNETKRASFYPSQSVELAIKASASKHNEMLPN